jgi:F-type H+-transporting ATPase subunit b
VLIDWFTVAAQALNFLVLVWLLKRFLYRPVLDAVSAREQRIAKQLSDAAAQAASATSEREQFEHKNAEFDAKRAALLDAAREQAKTEGAKLLELARQQADALRSRLQESWRDEQQLLGAEIARRTSDEVFAIARKTLADLAGAGLEESMTRVFVSRLDALGDSDRSLLAAAAVAAASDDAGAGAKGDAGAKADAGAKGEAAGAALIVRTAFELPAAQRGAIEQSITRICGTAARVSYQTLPGLVTGIELCASGHKLAWSIDDYMRALEKSTDATLATATAAATAAATPPAAKAVPDAPPSPKAAPAAPQAANAAQATPPVPRAVPAGTG